LTGQIDALGSSTSALVVLNRGKPQKEFEAKITLVQNHFGIGMRRGQTDLRQWVNTFLYAIKNNGELDAISQKWIGESLQPLPTF
jgi:polar amino acid transport system substrate-binding protein